MDQSGNPDYLADFTSLRTRTIQKTLSDPVNQEVFKSIMHLTNGDTDKISFDALNEQMSKMREADVLRGVKALQKTQLISQDIDLDLENPTDAQTYYSLSQLPPALKNEVDMILTETPPAIEGI